MFICPLTGEGQWWWSSELGEDWEPVERGEFDDVDEPDEVSHLA